MTTSDLFSLIQSIYSAFLSIWWIFIPLFLFILAKDLWIKYKRQEFIQKMDWIVLEVRPPQDIKKTPYAMEQFFAGLHGSQSNPNFGLRFLQGATQSWFSMEMVSSEGDIHFFIKTLSVFRNLVESNIYAQYPHAEINQVDDYTDVAPTDIPNDDYELWGTELVLTKDDAYPIRTYVEFEKDIVADEQRIDPLAALLEAMTKIGVGEHIWIQTLIRPIGDKWKEEGEKLRDDLIGRKKESKSGILGAIGSELNEWRNVTSGAGAQMVVGGELILDEPAKEEKKDDKPSMASLTKSEQEVINALEKNMSKFGYEVIIRFVYFGRKDIFNKANVVSVLGSFKQFGTQHLNGFKPNAKVTPGIDYSFQGKGTRDAYRKKRVFGDYKKRSFAQYSKYISYLNPLFFERWPILNWFFVRSQPFVLSIEELATIYHYPGEMVKTPMGAKVQAKKGGAPAGLPIG